MRRAADGALAADWAWSAALVAVLLSLMGSQRCAPRHTPLAVGDTAPYDIRASFDIDVVDETLTEELRRQAREEIHDVYVYDSQRRWKLGRDLSSLFVEGRRTYEELSLQGAERPAQLVAARLAGRVAEAPLRVMIDRRFDVAIEREMTSALTAALRGPIVGNKPLLEREPAIVMLQLPERRASRLEDFATIRDAGEVREALAADLERRLRLPSVERRALIDLATSFVDANLHLDAEATAQRRAAAAAAVPPVRVRVARGDLLVRKGETLSSETLARIKATIDAQQGRLGPRELMGLLLLSGMLAFFVWRYSNFHQRRYRKLAHLHALMVLVLLSVLLLSEAMLWVSGEVVDGLSAPFDDLSRYVYLAPLGAGSILVVLLANGRIATVYAAFGALLFGAVNGWDYHLTFWALIVQLAGVYAITTFRDRAALIRAGLVVGGVGAVAVLALETLQGELEPLSRSAFGAGLAFVGGTVGVGLLVSFSLPLLERLFNVLTDIRLLELSHVNHPLLSQLAIKAPGSYNHSLVVATLAEEAAKAIGANSLFCRVAAFYHDIGKINHAEYFVENQRGANPHDRLSPSMSALIITSHVKDGIKLAREAGLPQQIVDIIPQHHGTRKMTFFLAKARSSADPALGKASEEDFRYPGPKPETREAAIFMLADAVEAAARTVDEPTPNRLREVIRKVSEDIVLDHQLDSCDLTFSDLDRIQKAFQRLLVGMYHHRVDYPGFEFGRSKASLKAGSLAVARKVVRGS